MANFLSTSAVGLNGGGSPLAEASASTTVPPWQQEELLYEPPLRASHGFVTTHYTEGGHEDHITSFPTFTEQEESSMGDSSGGFVLASSQQDPLQSSDPWAGQSSGPIRTATSLLQGLWDRWGPTTPTSADVTQQTYGPARSQPRPHSDPAETRTTMWSPDATAAPQGGMSNATTPAAPSRSTPIPVPPARGGTTPVGVRGAAPMYTMADIQSCDFPVLLICVYFVKTPKVPQTTPKQPHHAHA